MKSKKKGSTKYPMTPIVATAKALAEIGRRKDAVLDKGDDEKSRSYRKVAGEWEATIEHILKLHPTNYVDAAIQLMLVYDAASTAQLCCGDTNQDGDGEEDGEDRHEKTAEEHLEQLVPALARLLRFATDASGVDLSEFCGAYFLMDEPDEFPEFNDYPAAAE
jgi:hypothetical protein